MSEQLSYFQRMQKIKLGLLPKESGPKPKKRIAPISEKKKKELKEAKDVVTGETELDAFFERNRKRMVGVCQCGCARKSSKNEDKHYRASIAHIFPKRIFKSIACNDYNWVERNFWEGCHTNMDNKSIEEWVNMADWDDIKEKFYQLAPLFTDEEKKTKFYSLFEKLVYVGR